MKATLFWRNTKESVKEQIELPPVLEKIYFIEFSDIEKVLYDSRKITAKSVSELREFCAIPNQGRHYSLESKYLEAVRQVEQQIQYTRVELRRIQQILEQQTRTLEDWNRQLQLHGDPENAKYIHDRIRETTGYSNSTRTSIASNKNTIIQRLAQLSILSTVLENNNSTCPLCNKIIYFYEVTPCGHRTCVDCITNHLLNNSTCPICDEPLIQSAVTTQLVSRIVINNRVTNPLVARYGSKLIAIAGYLQEVVQSNDNVKVIVFSQDEERLVTLSSILLSYDEVSCNNQMVHCKGTISQRRKAIERFNSEEEGSARILLLSLAHNASGTQLPIATHIVLVDPVVGSKDNAKALDSQAIARAHRIGQGKPVTAIRFIIKNSIEQNDYEAAYGAIHTAEPSTFTITEHKLPQPEMVAENQIEDAMALVPPVEEPAEESDEEFELEKKPKQRSKSPKKSPIKKRSKSPKKPVAKNIKKASPKKNKKIVAVVDESEEEESEEEEKPVKRRGRPPKKVIVEESDEEFDERKGKSKPAKKSAKPKAKKVVNKKQRVEKEMESSSEEETNESEEEFEEQPKRRGRPPKRKSNFSKSPQKKKQKVK